MAKLSNTDEASFNHTALIIKSSAFRMISTWMDHGHGGALGTLQTYTHMREHYVQYILHSYEAIIILGIMPECCNTTNTTLFICLFVWFK